MTRSTIGAALLGFAALLTGCGPEKLLPTEGLRPDGGPVQQPVPTKSDPEAKAIVDRAVTAYTDGKPERLAKGKVCRSTMKGQMYLGNPNQADDTTRALAAVWPDRFHFTNEGESNGVKLVVESWMRRPDVIVRGNGADQRVPNPAEYEQNLASDVVGQIWMALLVPPTDPRAVVFDPQTIILDHRDLKLVKLSLGEFPVYQLYFDGKTDALVRVEYGLTELGAFRHATMIFADHKRNPDGLLLPNKLECLRNKTTVEKWTVEKWEFPPEIKDDEFAPKKK